MKIKTSVSIDRQVLEKLKGLAREQDRSVSYLLQKFIESRVMELPVPPGVAEPEGEYRTRKKK